MIDLLIRAGGGSRTAASLNPSAGEVRHHRGVMDYGGGTGGEGR